MSNEIGENIVASYLRYIAGCELVLENTYLTDRQGEVDVIGVHLASRTVYLCEVTTHILGMLYGSSREATVQKVREKILRAMRLAAATFPDLQPRFEVWSPVVKPTLAADLAGLSAEFHREDVHFTLVTNEVYSGRVGELIGHARSNSSMTADPAYRLLQILTRLQPSPLTLQERRHALDAADPRESLGNQ